MILWISVTYQCTNQITGMFADCRLIPWPGVTGPRHTRAKITNWKAVKLERRELLTVLVVNDSDLRWAPILYEQADDCLNDSNFTQNRTPLDPSRRVRKSSTYVIKFKFEKSQFRSPGLSIQKTTDLLVTSLNLYSIPSSGACALCTQSPTPSRL